MVTLHPIFSIILSCFSIYVFETTEEHTTSTFFIEYFPLAILKYASNGGSWISPTNTVRLSVESCRAKLFWASLPLWYEYAFCNKFSLVGMPNIEVWDDWEVCWFLDDLLAQQTPTYSTLSSTFKERVFSIMTRKVSQTNATACQQCPAGTYSSTYGTNSTAFYLDCLPGTYSGESGKLIYLCPLVAFALVRVRSLALAAYYAGHPNSQILKYPYCWNEVIFPIWLVSFVPFSVLRCSFPSFPFSYMLYARSITNSSTILLMPDAV